MHLLFVPNSRPWAVGKGSVQRKLQLCEITVAWLYETLGTRGSVRRRRPELSEPLFISPVDIHQPHLNGVKRLKGPNGVERGKRRARIVLCNFITGLPKEASRGTPRSSINSFPPNPRSFANTLHSMCISFPEQNPPSRQR